MRSTPNGLENWLVGKLAADAPLRSAILQDQPIARFLPKQHRHLFSATYFEKDLALRVGMIAKRTEVPSEAEEQVKRFVRDVVAKFAYPVSQRTAASLESRLLNASRRFAAYQQVYARFFDRVEPRVVVMGNASYMNRSPLLPILRERGIYVMEPQHGWIGPSHAAYNFGHAFSEPSLKAYLPDALLTFGDYWSERVRHPAAKIAVGKVALTDAVARTRNVEKRDQVLLISSIYRTEELIRFATLLRQRLPSDLTVVLRPHPSERASAGLTYGSLLDVDGFAIDYDTDLYRSFSRARAVIGHSSTVLFEALPFEIPTFVLDSPLADLYTPREVFGERLSANADGAEKITGVLESRVTHVPPIHISKIWAPEPSSKFNELLESATRMPPQY